MNISRKYIHFVLSLVQYNNVLSTLIRDRLTSQYFNTNWNIAAVAAHVMDSLPIESKVVLHKVSTIT